MFKKQTHSYASAAAEQSPFARASQVWDDRIGSARVQARNWRAMALAATALSGGLALGLLYQGSQTRVAAYVVEVDPQGRTGRVELIDRGYNPTAAQVAFHVAELVRHVRSRPTDPVVLKQDWESAYRFLAGDAVAAMSEYASHAGLADPAKRDTAVEAEVVNVLQRSEGTYQVRWRETAYEHGTRASTTDWTGLFTTRLAPPRTARAVFENPLGVYVTHFTWSQEFAGVGGGGN